MSALQPPNQMVHELSVQNNYVEMVIGILIQRGFSSFEELEADVGMARLGIWTAPDLTAPEIEAWFEPISVHVHSKPAPTYTWDRNVMKVGQFRLVTQPEHRILATDICLLDGVGFGWGEHATTQLGLKFLSETKSTLADNVQCLDFGSGTGILAIAALLRGAARVDAIEIDDATRQTLATNALANEVTDKLIIGRSLLEVSIQYDLVMANIFVNILRTHLSALVCRLRPNGRLWLSGFTADWRATILKDCEALGLRHVETQYIEDWIGMTLVYSVEDGRD